MKKIYISGKITGDDNFKDKFASAETELKNSGWTNVVNPINTPEQTSWEDYMIKDIEQLFGCHAIYMIKDWIESKGSRIEHAIAKEMGIEIIHQ